MQKIEATECEGLTGKCYLDLADSTLLSLIAIYFNHEQDILSFVHQGMSLTKATFMHHAYPTDVIHSWRSAYMMQCSSTKELLNVASVSYSPGLHWYIMTEKVAF